jgi:hypothetical protein
LRRTEIAAGQSARASGLRDTELAVRRAPEQAPESVDPLVVPAIQPAPAATGVARSAAAPLPAVLPAAPDPADHRGARAPDRPEAVGLAPVVAAPGARHGARPAVDPAGAAAAAPQTVVARDQGQPTGAAAGGDRRDPSSDRRAKLDRLTEGMLDGLRPPPPTWTQP